MSPFASMLPRLARGPMVLLLGLVGAAILVLAWPRPAHPRASEVCTCAHREVAHVRTQFAAPPPPVDCRYPVNRDAHRVQAVPAHWAR